MLRRKQLVIGALAVAAVVVGACGGDDDGGGDGLTTGPGDAGAVTVVAQDTLRFDEDSYSARAGEV
ncbi:MAG TPA: hypothetical protein VFI47_18485, partial [Acidimicrobiales bacterium]|nr:hypothetical protein [Acidimicrobiales bacterium]